MRYNEGNKAKRHKGNEKNAKAPPTPGLQRVEAGTWNSKLKTEN
jgi:hypothetical protein